MTCGLCVRVGEFVCTFIAEVLSCGVVDDGFLGVE